MQRVERDYGNLGYIVSSMTYIAMKLKQQQRGKLRSYERKSFEKFGKGSTRKSFEHNYRLRPKKGKSDIILACMALRIL